MASRLFGNNHRLKLVDDEEGGGPTESSFRTDWSSILKPNRRPHDTKLSKEDSMASFDADSLLSSVDGSGEPDSLAPQASNIRGEVTGTGGNRRALHLPPAYNSGGRATPDTTMALAPSIPSARSKSMFVDSCLDSTLQNLPSTNRRHTGSTTTTNSSSSLQDRDRQIGSFGSHFFAQTSNGGKGGAAAAEWTTHTLKSETSLSFFDPNASRESFFLDDHTAEEQDEIDDSERHTTRPLFNGIPSSRSIPLEGSFSAFSLEPEEDEADELISPGTPATGTSSSYSKPKLGLVRNDMPNVRWRTADFGVEDFQVTTPTSRSDRSRSRRSLPSTFFQSASMVEHETISPTPNRSLRASRRTTMKVNDLGKSPRLSTTAIDLTKANEVAREKSNNLNSHRSSMRTKSMQRSSNRTKISKDREAIEGRLNSVLGGGDHDDETGLPPLQTPEGSHRSRRSSNSNSTNKQESSRRSSQRERSSSNDFDFDDVDVPGFMSKSSKTQVSGSHENTNNGKSGSGCPTSESPGTTQFHESESSRRSRTLNMKFAKENKDKNVSTIELTRVNERPSLRKSSSETSRSRRNLKDNTNTPIKTSTVEDDTKNSSRRTRTSSPRKSRIISETQGENSKGQTRGEGTLQDEFPLTRQMSKKGLDIDVLSGSEAHAKSPSESIWEKIEKEKERKQKIRDHIQFIQNDKSHLVSPSASRNSAVFADFENSVQSMTANFTALATEDSFSVDFNKAFVDTTPKKQIGTGTAPREVARVEPRIIRPGLGPSIPSSLKEASVQNKDESLDLSGHTNYTRSANWNWEEDHWDESKARLSQPTTIQEGDEDADDTFGSPIRITRKSINANVAKSPDFLSPIVHKKKSISSILSPQQPKLNDFFETNDGGSPHWMETLKMDRSVSSAPSMDPFPSRELSRTKSMGRPPRPLVPERHPRRSDPSPRAVTETITPSSRRQQQQQQQQRTTANETPSPRAVKDVFDQDNVKQKPTSATGKAVVRRHSGSTRRDTHEQRKGTVRDAMFNFLNE